jgi:protein phosphatase
VVEIVVADPSLIVLVGAAGSGKSTFAARHFAPGEVLSSDAFRAVIAGDETDQRATRAAFGRLHRELVGRLMAGRLTVVDATNVEAPARRALIARARAAAVPTTAVVLDLPPSLVLARNAARSSRVVAEAVVRHHLERLRSALDGRAIPFDGEGFSQVVVLREPGEVDAASVIRAVRASAG